MQSHTSVSARATSIGGTDTHAYGDVAASAERLAREPPADEDASALQALHSALQADPTAFRARELSPTPMSADELTEWQPLMRSSALAHGQRFAVGPVVEPLTARKRKRTGADSAVATAPDAATATVSPVPRLVHALHVLWAYSTSLETIELAQCALTPSAVALLCTALSGIDAHRADSRAGGGLRSLTIARNGTGGRVAAPQTGSSAWHVAQWLRTNASLRRLALTDNLPVCATDLADVCDALLARRDAYGATLEHLDISNNHVFGRPNSPSPQWDEYQRVLARISAFGARNAASDRVCIRAMGTGATDSHPRRHHFPAALQSVEMRYSGYGADALAALRAAGQSAVRDGDPHADDDGGRPGDALTALHFELRWWQTDGAERMAEWIGSRDCTLRALYSPWAPSHLPSGRSDVSLPRALECCALFANASLTALTIANDKPLTNAEFVALLSAARTHPALRQLAVGPTRVSVDRAPPFAVAAPPAFAAVATADFPAACAALLSRFVVHSDDDRALPSSARTQAVAELLAFGSDHLEDVAAQGLFGLVNGTHIALAQRWVTSGECHTAVCDPVRTAVEAALAAPAVAAAPELAPAATAVSATASASSSASNSPLSYASMGAIEKRLCVAQGVARFSSLKRLVIDGDIAALMALRTALAPPHGVLSRSLQALVLTAAVTDYHYALVRVNTPYWPAQHLRLRPFLEAHPWLALGSEAEADAAAEAAGHKTVSQAVTALLAEGLRHNTALTDLTVDGHALTDTVVTAGLMALCLPSLCAAVASAAEGAAPYRLRRHTRAIARSPLPYADRPANRTLRRVEFSGAAFSVECLPAIAQLIAGARTHGLREVHILSPKSPLPRREVEAALVPALTALRRAGDGWFACRFTDAGDDAVSVSLSALSDDLQSRAAHATRQWARLAVVLAAYRAHRTHQFLANSVQPLLPVIVALSGLARPPLLYRED